MSEQDLRTLLLVDLVLLTVAVLGVAVWTGRWRSWVELEPHYRDGGLLFPWFTPFAIIIRTALFLKLSLGIDLLIYEMIALATGCMVIGLSAASLHWPKWALPPWYREYLNEKQSKRDGRDEAAR